MIDPIQGEIERLFQQSHAAAREAIRSWNGYREAKREGLMNLAETMKRDAQQHRIIADAKLATAQEMVRRYGRQIPLPLPPSPDLGIVEATANGD